MKLLILDFESQSDDPSTTNPTEVGALLVQLGGGAFKTLERLSQLIWEESYPPQTDEIIEITGITDAMLQAEGKAAREVFERLHELVDLSDYVLAHNKSFDETVYRSTCKRLGVTPAEPRLGWLCTIQDVPYAKKYKCKKLSHLAYDHGILVDPSTLHRAINDVELLAQLILTKYKFSDIVTYYETPWIILALNGVRGPWEDGGRTNAQAKKLGFSWEKVFQTDLSFPKRWVKRVKEDQAQAEKAKIPPHFTLTKLQET